jgi:hypothetical protein
MRTLLRDEAMDDTRSAENRGITRSIMRSFLMENPGEPLKDKNVVRLGSQL